MLRSRLLPALIVGWVLLGLMSPGVVTAQETRVPPTTGVTLEKADASGAPKAQAPSETRGAAKKAKGGIGRGSVLQLIRTANPMLWPLVLCSIVTVGYALERMIALRRGRVVPHDFVNRFLERLGSGKLDRDRATELCRANESPVARIFAQAVRYWGQPAATIRQAIEHDAAGELADLKRNVRVLNGTATLAPLLGLLGTVFGMIEAFEALGNRGVSGNKGEALAHGISLALMATAAGLVIAIVSVAAYYYLLNRIDVLVRELDEQTRRVIDLVAGDEARPPMERRVLLNPNDHGRHEPRPLGRSEPV